MPILLKMIDNSFISAMFRSRCVFLDYFRGLGDLDAGSPEHGRL